jgi:hypothetical protein
LGTYWTPGLLLFIPAKLVPTPVNADLCPVELVESLFGQQEITEPQNSSQDMFASPLWTDDLKSCSGVMELSSPA